jgi:tetratricopeptide (TPR) repeat protein
MPGTRIVVSVAVTLLGGSLLLDSAPSHAQGMGTGDGTANTQPTRETPAMRERVYSRLAEAQACSEMDDLVCAQELLEEVRAMDGLNSYEIAQMWNFYAFIYFGQDNYPEAINAYEMVLVQPDLPLGMETTTRFTLCQLYFQQERYQDSLDMLDQWFTIAENPGPDPYILRAQIYYQLQQYREGIEPVLQAIEVAQVQGQELQENWYRLLNVFYYELEDYPNVINVLRTIIDTWPKREYFIQLSAMYGQEGDEARQLALYETAYEAGWLERSNEFVQLAQLLLGADIPVKAAKIMEAGLEDGTIESTENNWRVLAQAWQLAQEDVRALPALGRAASMSENGEIDLRLAQSHQNLANWQDCVDTAREGLRKGDLRRPDQGNMILGACLFELEEYTAARAAFEEAEEDTRSRAAAQSWIQYVDSEEQRENELQAALNR